MVQATCHTSSVPALKNAPILYKKKERTKERNILLDLKSRKYFQNDEDITKGSETILPGLPLVKFRIIWDINMKIMDSNPLSTYESMF